MPPPADSVGCSTTSWRFDEKQTALRISSFLASSKVVKQCRTCKAVRYDNNKQQTTSTSNCAFLAFRLSRPRTTTTLTTTTGRVQLNRQEMLVVVFTRSLPLVVLAWFDGQLANKRAARIPAVLACPGVRRDCWRRFSKKRLRLRRVGGIRITHRHTHTRPEVHGQKARLAHTNTDRYTHTIYNSSCIWRLSAPLNAKMPLPIAAGTSYGRIPFGTIGVVQQVDAGHQGMGPVGLRRVADQRA